MLGRMYDAHRVPRLRPGRRRELAKYAGVPVYNGLTDEYHPTQMLADVLTMREHSDKPLHEIKYAFLGDARNNMGNSLMIVGCHDGHGRAHLRRRSSCGRPTSYVDDRAGAARTRPARSSRSPTTRQEAVKGVDFIHTDVWVSMGEPKEVWEERIKLLTPYQVNTDADEGDRQPARQVHALPAGLPRHRDQGRQGDRREVGISTGWR